MKPQQVAEFMHSLMVDRSWDYADTIVHRIRNECSGDHVFRNVDGKLKIRPATLKAFREMTRDELIWSKDGSSWREPRHDEIDLLLRSSSARR